MKNSSLRYIYFAGVFCFVTAAFCRTIPDKATDSEGKTIELWCYGTDSHLKLALEPVVKIYDYFTAKKDPDEHGDGFEYEKAQDIKRLLYALLPCLGWWMMLGSFPVVMIFNLQRRPARHRRRNGWVGWILLISALLVAYDFYQWATVYPGYFHLGAGAYYLTLSYVLIGMTFIKKCGTCSKANVSSL